MTMQSTAPDQSQIRVLPLHKAEVVSQDWGELTWYANRELGNSEDITVGRCLLKPGRSNPRHHHPNCSEVLVVMQGRIRHTIEGEREAELNEGDTVTIAPNVWHRATNIGDNDALLFIAFSSAARETIGE